MIRFCITRCGLASLLLFLCARPLHAFTYREHCRTSNAALELATRYALQTPELSRALNGVQLERLRQLSRGRCDPRTPESYGDFVALADYALTPVEYYAYVPNTRTPLLLTDDELPWSSIEAMGGWRLQNLRSAHVNEDHFEDRALLSQFIWHEAATHFAADREQLMTALLLNAFSDHFLQDFFAPGHIHTPRRRLHDITALGRHDDFNRRGERFYPTRTNDLVPLLSLSDPATLAACGGASAATCLSALQDSGFTAGGDGRLEHLPVQRMFLTLVTARSILDVLHSFAERTPSSSFRTAEWHEGESHDDPSQSGLLIDVRPPGEPRDRVTRAGIAYGEFRWQAPAEVAELALGVTAGHQSIIASDGGSAALGLVGVELAYYRTSGFGREMPRRRAEASFRQTGLAFSYTLYYGAGKPLHGFATRLILPMTEINTQLSVGGFARVRGEKLSNVAWGPEARVEMGFGVAFLGLGIGRESQARLGVDEQRWVITSSVSFAAPLSSVGQRLPRIRRAVR